MVKEGKFYVGEEEVVEFRVYLSQINVWYWEYIVADLSRDEHATLSDPFDTPEDALANLLMVLNEG